MLKRAHWFGVAFALLLAPLGGMVWGCQGTCTSTNDCANGEFCSMANGACSTARALGFCKPVGIACNDVGPVVCGCDGKTYANACQASVAGQSGASLGPCVIGCGGPSNLPCPDPAHQFCQHPDGNCGLGGTIGTCTPKPTGNDCAAATPSLVCGCGNTTFNNRCDAEKAGQSIASLGGCPCGGPDDVKCAQAGTYCNFTLGTCGGANPAGTCASIPASCEPVSTPVCGCDFKTYDNPCEAARAAVGIYTLSQCPCGGPDGIKCLPNEYCELGIGGCPAGNANGVCRPKPTSCVAVHTAVCGCDNMPYLNPCEAEKAGTSVAVLGACPP